MSEKVFRDDRSGLFWERKSFGNRRLEYSVEEAFLYAGELSAAKYGGFDDWRIPSLDELKSICTIKPYEYNGDYNAWRAWYEGIKDGAVCGFFAVEALCGDMGQDGWYWSSTKKGEGEYYLLNFKEANTNFHIASQSFYVRCVRG